MLGCMIETELEMKYTMPHPKAMRAVKPACPCPLFSQKTRTEAALNTHRYKKQRTGHAPVIQLPIRPGLTVKWEKKLSTRIFLL